MNEAASGLECLESVWAVMGLDEARRLDRRRRRKKGLTPSSRAERADGEEGAEVELGKRAKSVRDVESVGRCSIGFVSSMSWSLVKREGGMSSPCHTSTSLQSIEANNVQTRPNSTSALIALWSQSLFRPILPNPPSDVQALHVRSTTKKQRR